MITISIKIQQNADGGLAIYLEPTDALSDVHAEHEPTDGTCDDTNDRGGRRRVVIAKAEA